MKNKILIFNVIVDILKISCLMLPVIVLIYISGIELNKNVKYDIDKTPVYVEAKEEGSFFIPNLNNNTEIFKISENNTALVLSNPENNTHLLKYEIYFKDLNFSIWSNCIAAGKSEKIELYDKFKEGNYNVIIKMSFWIDENLAYDGTVYSFDTQLHINK